MTNRGFQAGIGSLLRAVRRADDRARLSRCRVPGGHGQYHSRGNRDEGRSCTVPAEADCSIGCVTLLHGIPRVQSQAPWTAISLSAVLNSNRMVSPNDDLALATVVS